MGSTTILKTDIDGKITLQRRPQRIVMRPMDELPEEGQRIMVLKDGGFGMIGKYKAGTIYYAPWFGRFNNYDGWLPLDVFVLPCPPIIEMEFNNET